MSTDKGTAEPRAPRRRPAPDDAALAAALGSLLRLSSAESATLSPAARAAMSPTGRAAMSGSARPARAAAALLVSFPSMRPAGPSEMPAPVPVPPVPDDLDDDSFWGPSPIDVHPGVAGRRVADGTVPPPAVPDAAAAFTASPHEDVPDWYTTPVLSVDAPPRPTSTTRAVLTIAGQWWATRRRELLPGLVVGSLVILAFVVVLLSGGKGAGTSRVGTTRVVPIDPSTTIPGLFATAATEAEIAPPEDDAPLDVDAPFDVDKAPATTKPKASVATTTPPSRPKSPPATSPPATSPPATQPPVTEPPVTTPPTTEPPVTTPPTTVGNPPPADAARGLRPPG